MKRTIFLAALGLAVFAAAVSWRFHRSDTLTIACLTKTQAQAIERLALDAFRASRPDVDVRVVYLFKNGDDIPADIEQTLPERVQRVLRSKADIYAGLPAECVRVLAARRAIAPLDDLLSRHPDVLDNMAAPVESMLRAEGDGKLYAVAPTFGSMALAYNKDLFDAAKVSYPSGTMTWEQAFALGEKVASRSASGTAAFLFGPEDFSDFHSAFLQIAPSAGVYVYDGATLTVDDALVRLWERFADAERRYALSKDGNAFWRGEAAMTLVYNGQVDDPSTFQTHPTFSKFEWDLAPMPVFDLDYPVSYANVESAMVLSADSEHVAEAAEFLAWVCGPEHAAALARMTTLPWYGSLPSYETSATIAALRTRADKDYSAFYAHRAPRERALPSTEYGQLLLNFLIQRLMVDTLNGRIDTTRAAHVLDTKGRELYSIEGPVPMGDPVELQKLIEY